MLDIQKIAKGQVWWADLGETDDRIVSGNRPVIVLQKCGIKVICIPTTKSSERYLNVDFRVSLSASFDSFTMVDNVVTIDENRLLEYKGTLDDDVFGRVIKNFMSILSGDIIIRDGIFYYREQYYPPVVEKTYSRNDRGQLLSVSVARAQEEQKEESEVETIIRKEDQEHRRFSSKTLTEEDKIFIITHDFKEARAVYGMSSPSFYSLRKKFIEEQLQKSPLGENERLIASKSDEELKQLGISSQVAKFYRRQLKTKSVKNITQ